MKYWCRNTPTKSGDIVETFSEEELIQYFYGEQYTKMVAKYGKEHVDKNYLDQDFIDDWVSVNYAWESD